MNKVLFLAVLSLISYDICAMETSPKPKRSVSFSPITTEYSGLGENEWQGLTEEEKLQHESPLSNEEINQTVRRINIIFNSLERSEKNIVRRYKKALDLAVKETRDQKQKQGTV